LEYRFSETIESIWIIFACGFAETLCDKDCEKSVIQEISWLYIFDKTLVTNIAIRQHLCSFCLLVYFFVSVFRSNAKKRPSNKTKRSRGST